MAMKEGTAPVVLLGTHRVLAGLMERQSLINGIEHWG